MTERHRPPSFAWRSLCLAFLALAPACGASQAGPTAPDPTGRSLRNPTSMHAHQRDWPDACRLGELQSPISLSSTDFVDAPSETLAAHFGRSEVALLDTGHTLQLRVLTSEDAVTFEGVTYALRQVHFHKPSEHIIDGHQAPMEMHVVWVSLEGRVLVLGYPIEVGADHPVIAALWPHLEDREGYGEDMSPDHAWERAIETSELDLTFGEHGEHLLADRVELRLGDLLPARSDFFVYEGSLTTPACDEGVTHAVSSTPVFWSDAQIERFEGYYEGNNRDLQPLGSLTTRRLRRAILRP